MKQERQIRFHLSGTSLLNCCNHEHQVNEDNNIMVFVSGPKICVNRADVIELHQLLGKYLKATAKSEPVNKVTYLPLEHRKI